MKFIGVRGPTKETGSRKSVATGGPDDVIVFTFEDLRSVVVMDLEYRIHIQYSRPDYSKTEVRSSNWRHTIKFLC